VAHGGDAVCARREGLAAARWRGFVRAHVVARLGGDSAARVAADLHVSSSTADTAGKYEQHWRQFSSFCAATNRTVLPATPDTVAAYLASIYTRGTVRPSSLQSYLTPINTRHATAGYPPPATGPFLSSVRTGFTRCWLDRTGVLPPERAKFPAAAAWAIAEAAAKATCPATRAKLTTITTAFLFFRRTAELLRLTVADVRLRADGGVDFQVVRYKNAERRRGGHRLSYTIPPAPHAPDLPLDLLRDRVSWLVAAGAPPEQPLFSALGDRRPPTRDAMAGWLTDACASLGLSAPVGSFFSPYSTRGGAATAAYAAGVSDGRIVALLGHSRRDTVTAHTHYIDALVDPCPAARRFFDRFLPRG